MSPGAETLLEHTTWLRDLARQLVREEAAADDLVQETCLTALTRPPRRWDSPRGWLGTVLRGHAYKSSRAAGRRQRHETRVPLAAAGTATDEVVRRAETQRDLVNAVLALEEPYRSVLLLRYWDDLPPQAIAERRGGSPATVRSQLRRGLAQLRARLDADHRGDRSAWVSALFPIAGLGPHGAAPAPALGTAFGGKKAALVLAVAVSLVAVGATLVVRALDRPATANPVALDDPLEAPAARADERAGDDPSAPAPAGLPRPPALPDAAPAEVSGDPGGSPAPGAGPDLEAGRFTVAVRSLDGEGIPGAEVSLTAATAWDPRGEEVTMGASSCADPDAGEQAAPKPVKLPEVLGVSDEAGLLRVPAALPPRFLTVRAASAGYMTVFPAVVDWRSGRVEHSPVIWVAPRKVLRGEVVSGSGQRLSDAWIGFVRTEPTLHPGVSADDVPAPSPFAECQTRTDGNGQFRLELPWYRGARIEVEAQDHERQEIRVFAHGDDFLRVVLERAQQDVVVRGRILLPDGAPAVGARVCHERGLGWCDEEGRFELRLAEPLQPGLPLFVIDPSGSCAPIVLEHFGQTRQGQPGELLLRFPGPARRLGGRLLDARGAPLPGWQVRLADAVPLSSREYPPLQAEAMTARLDGLTCQLTTGAEGEFLFPGLRQRDYEVFAFDPSSLVWIRQRISAGTTDAALRVSPDAVQPVVEGFVRSRSGAPLAGAEVALVLDTGDASTVRSRPAVTDAAGFFTLHDVPRRGVRVCVSGPELATLERELPAPGAPWELRVARARRLRVELAELPPGPAPAWVRVLDAQGRPLTLTRVGRDGSQRSSAEWELESGLSPELRVAEDAREAEFLDANREAVGRVRLTLDPAQVTVLSRFR